VIGKKKKNQASKQTKKQKDIKNEKNLMVVLYDVNVGAHDRIKQFYRNCRVTRSDMNTN
jgi:hypothetical protein